MEFLAALKDSMVSAYEKVETIECDPAYNANFDNQQVALDSGMIKVVRRSDAGLLPIFQVESDDLDVLTTVNKVYF